MLQKMIIMSRRVEEKRFLCQDCGCLFSRPNVAKLHDAGKSKNCPRVGQKTIEYTTQEEAMQAAKVIKMKDGILNKKRKMEEVPVMEVSKEEEKLFTFLYMSTAETDKLDVESYQTSSIDKVYRHVLSRFDKDMYHNPQGGLQTDHIIFYWSKDRGISEAALINLINFRTGKLNYIEFVAALNGRELEELWQYFHTPRKFFQHWVKADEAWLGTVTLLEEPTRIG
jgi:hypothetical protein